MSEKNSFIKLGNLLVSENLIKSIKVFEDFELQVPEGYEGNTKKVFKVTVILYEPIRPETGYSFNLFESDARLFLAQLDINVAVGGNQVLEFTTDGYAKSVFTKLPEPEEPLVVDGNVDDGGVSGEDDDDEAVGKSLEDSTWGDGEDVSMRTIRANSKS